MLRSMCIHSLYYGDKIYSVDSPKSLIIGFESRGKYKDRRWNMGIGHIKTELDLRENLAYFLDGSLRIFKQKQMCKDGSINKRYLNSLRKFLEIEYPLDNLCLTCPDWHPDTKICSYEPCEGCDGGCDGVCDPPECRYEDRFNEKREWTPDDWNPDYQWDRGQETAGETI